MESSEDEMGCDGMERDRIGWDEKKWIRESG